jgi:hypothetical protein
VAYPKRGFVRVKNSFSDTSANKSGGLALRAKHGWHRVAATFTENDDFLPLPVLVAGIAAVAGVLSLICWLYIATEVAGIDFSQLASAADDAAFDFVSHHLP